MVLGRFQNLGRPRELRSYMTRVSATRAAAVNARDHPHPRRTPAPLGPGAQGVRHCSTRVGGRRHEHSRLPSTRIPLESPRLNPGPACI